MGGLGGAGWVHWFPRHGVGWLLRAGWFSLSDGMSRLPGERKRCSVCVKILCVCVKILCVCTQEGFHL